MKLHLPKALLTAVLAALLLDISYAGTLSGNTYTMSNETVSSLDTTTFANDDGAFIRAGSDNVTATIENLIHADGTNLVVAGAWNNATASFQSLTIENLVIGSAESPGSAILKVGAKQTPENAHPAQAVTLNSITGKLKAEILEGSTLTLDINGQHELTEESMITGAGTLIAAKGTTLKLNLESDDSSVKSGIQVNAGASLVLAQKDALGWSSGQAPRAISLLGSSAEKATMQVSGKQTFCTTLNLRGYSEVTSGTAGTLQLHSGSSINASGINNEIAVSLTISRACTINVDDGGILKLSGGLSDHGNDLADDRIITKTGNGKLEITGGANFARVFKQNAGTTEISGAAATFQQGINVAEGATFTAISDVVLGGTIVNNGTVNISGTLSLNPIDVSNFVLKSYGTESGKYTDGENGWKTYYGNSYYLVDTDNSNSVLRVDTDAIRLGENNNIQLDKTSEAGKISFTYEAAGYDSASSYYVNTGTVQAASNYASNFVIAEGATLKISDELADTKTYNVTGTGTLAVSIAKTTGHGNIVDAAGFNGILALSKGGNSSKGNVELNKYNDNTYLGADASLKLISGNHWSGGDTTLTRDILLAGEAEGDFKFCHTNTLTLSGKVTGTYLYAGGEWNQNVDTCAGSTANHLKLSGAGSDIDSVKMINASTLTVAETMRFGKISANKVVIEASKQLNIGKQGIEGGSTISTLEMGQNAILNVQNGAVVTVNSKLKGGSAKVTDSSLLRIDGNTTVENLASVELSNGSTLSVRNGQYGHTFASAISVLGTNILTSGWGGNDKGGINGSINGAGTLQLGQEIWQGSETGDRWILNSTISDKSANEKLAINSFANVRITGQNTYSGGTTITKGTMRTEHENALGTGTVKMLGGTLEMAAALRVTAMEYTNGTVNNGSHNLNVGTLTVTEDATMSLSGSGATTAAVVDLKSGATLSTTDTLTMGSLTMADGSTLAASGTITLSGADNRVLDLGSRLTLDGEWFNKLLAELTGSNTATLFEGVTELKLNGVAYANQVDMADHFLNVEQGKYYLAYADNVVYAGLGEVIPEPTTATLSLLALAGLCARRRRRA